MNRTRERGRNGKVHTDKERGERNREAEGEIWIKKSERTCPKVIQ